MSKEFYPQLWGPKYNIIYPNQNKYMCRFSVAGSVTVVWWHCSVGDSCFVFCLCLFRQITEIVDVVYSPITSCYRVYTHILLHTPSTQYRDNRRHQYTYIPTEPRVLWISVGINLPGWNEISFLYLLSSLKACVLWFWKIKYNNFAIPYLPNRGVLIHT